MILSRYSSVIGLSSCILCIATLDASSEIIEESVRNAKGDLVFELRFFGPKDGEFSKPGGMPLSSRVSKKPFTSFETGAIKNAFAYWNTIIQPVMLESPSTQLNHTIFNIGHVNDPCTYVDGTTNLTRNKQPLSYGAHAYMYLGKDLEPQIKDHDFSHLIETSNKGSDLFSSAVRGVGHILYQTNLVERKLTRKELILSPQENKEFSETLTSFERYLYDPDDRQAKPKLPICSGEGICTTGFFKAKGMTFRGPETLKVLKGSMKGVTRVPRTDVDRELYTENQLKGLPVHADFKHLGLTNSILSHKPFNYSALMEIELAMLQDLGYDIDRRKFFGYSIYENYATIMNNAPFFERESGKYTNDFRNSSPLGIGLHVYGSFNRITQASKLWTDGPGAVGIRMDGRENELTISDKAHISADGKHGRGLLVSSGSHHKIIHAGTMWALGEGGIGALFAFGHSTDGEKNDAPLQETNAPTDSLVDLFVVAGELHGKKAALAIGDNAHVQAVHFVKDTKLIGNIISNYDAKRKNTFSTPLIFGAKKADFTQPDNSFILKYDGAIVGKNSLAPIFRGGTTQLLSKQHHEVYSMAIEPLSQLKINGSVRIPWGNTFLNEGNLKPSAAEGASFGSLRIQGDYRQSSQGWLKISFNPQKTDLLFIDGQAHMDGILILDPQPDFYPDNWESPSPFLAAGSIEGDFLEVRNSSPTLDFTLVYRTNQSVPFLDSRRTFETRHVKKIGTKKLNTDLETFKPQKDKLPDTQIQSPSINTENQTYSIRTQINPPQYQRGQINTCSQDSCTQALMAPKSNRQLSRANRTIREKSIISDTLSSHILESSDHDDKDFALINDELQNSSENLDPENVTDTLHLSESEQTMEKNPVAPHTDVSSEEDETEEALISLKSAPILEENLVQEEGLYEDFSSLEDHSLTDSYSLRPEDAYTRYAADINGQKVGDTLRRLVRTAAGNPALEAFYTALDFSARDGSLIRTALTQLTPASYSAVYGASVSREQQASDVLNAFPSPTDGPLSLWHIFAMPFGENEQQNSIKDMRVPYKGRERGLMFGAEHRSSPTSKWLWGIHGLVTQGDLSTKSDDRAHVDATGGDIGLHVRYADIPHKGIFCTAQARVGFLNNNMTRYFTIGSYGGPLSAQWTSLTATAGAMGGYLFKLIENLSVGPVGGVDYTSVFFPSLTETSSLPVALSLTDQTFYSAQGRLGIKARIDMSSTFLLEAQATWDQEFLNETLTQHAQIAAYADATFTSENAVLEGQTLTLQAQAIYNVTPHFTLAARGSKTLKSGVNITLGQLSGMWRF